MTGAATEADQGEPSAAARRRELVGLGEGLLAVFLFALTLPMSRFAVREVDPVTTGLFRCALAGVLATGALWFTRSRWPTRREWKGLAAASPGIVYIYPIFVAWAMKYTDSSHGSIVVGLLPLSTAAAAALLGYEKPGRRFWVAAVAGSAVVIVYTLAHGGGAFHPADLALVFAVLCSGVAYAEGGWLARELGGWQVISWIMAMNLPLVGVLLTASIWFNGFHPSWATLAVLIFMGIFNQYAGFFGWYKAMAQVGLARVSQLQLLQPFMTVAVAAVFLHERVSWQTWVALGLVICSVAAARRAAKRPVSPSPAD